MSYVVRNQTISKTLFFVFVVHRLPIKLQTSILLPRNQGVIELFKDNKCK